MEEKVVTIKDIAQDLGVSLSTVHKAIYQKKGISEEMRRRVMDYIEEHDFHINRTASALKRRAIRLAYVGIAPDSTRNFFYREINAGVMQAYEMYKSLNVDLQCYTTSDNVEEQIAVLEKLYEEQKDTLDGLLIVCIHEFLLNPILQRFKAAGIRIVSISSDAKNSKRDSFVGTDSIMAGNVVVELLLKLGIPQNGQILMVGGSQDYSNHRQLRKTFATAMAKIRPDVDIIDLFQEPTVHSIEDKIVKYLKAFPDISAVYCVTARATYSTCNAIRSLSLSGKLTTIGTDVFSELRSFFADDTLTATIFQDPLRQSERALSTLFDLITNLKPVEEYQCQRVSVVLRGNMDSFLVS